jgi:endonuclease/exonuclease/phosphatase family metal-dependent hydrolase
MPVPPRRSGSDWFIPAVVLIMLVLLATWLTQPDPAQPPATTKTPSGEGPASSSPLAPAEGYLFCHWNVENFYDDRDDPHNHDELEDRFRNPDVVREKVEQLSDALLTQNDGHGPDILAMVEVESRRSVELLRDALNAHLPPEWHYRGLIQRNYHQDRRLAPAVLTRLPVRDDLSRLRLPRRILEAHLEAAGAPLVILSSHWTSRLRGDTEAKREAYAAAVYAAFRALARSDPAADVLISGDFNDEPDDPSVRDDLHATGDPSLVVETDTEPRLLDLMIGLDPRRMGTFYYNGHWQILDHIVAAPGLLDPAGWQIVPETLRTANAPALRLGRTGRPLRFGSDNNQNPRGPSDHFALTVRLRVQQADSW